MEQTIQRREIGPVIVKAKGQSSVAMCTLCDWSSLHVGVTAWSVTAWNFCKQAAMNHTSNHEEDA
jgi:hypothetical protein